MKFVAVSTIALAGLLATGAAQAADRYDAVTGQDMVQILNEVGFEGTLTTDNEGDPMITGSIQGFKYTLFFYRCNVNKAGAPAGANHTGNCLDLQFHSSFKNDTNANYAAVNSYNRDNRFGQAFFQEDGQIGLDMSATLEGGVMRQHIKEIIDWWKVTLTAFPKKMGGS